MIVSWFLPNVNFEKNKLDTFVFPKDMGPHIYQTCPSANYFDCKAMAIGARSQVIALFFYWLLQIIEEEKITIMMMMMMMMMMITIFNSISFMLCSVGK